MRGMGTLINVLCILVGGVVGCLFGNRLKDSIRESLVTVCGVGVVILGIGGSLEKMLTMEDGKLLFGGSTLMIVSLVVGVVIGELLQIDQKVNAFGEWLKVKSHSTGDQSFVGGFVTTSCTVCIGAMAVIGAMQDGMSGDYSILVVKGLLDAIIVCVMAASMGKGCIFSAIPVGVLQGSVTVLAIFIGDFMSQAALDNLSMVGNVLIMCVGLNLLRTKQIRVANMLPAIVVAIAWGFVKL